MEAAWLKKSIGSVATLALAATLVIATPVPESAHAATSTKTAQKYDKDIVSIFNATNAVRAKAGKKKLKYDVRVTVVSYDWSSKMGRNNAFKHNPSYSKQIPSGWSRAGENVAYACGYGSKSAQVIANNWVKSPGHYKNLVGDFTSIGIGVYWIDGCMYATQNFAKYKSPKSYALPGTKVATSKSKSTVSANYSYKYKSQLKAAKTASSKAAKAKKSASSYRFTAKKNLAKAKKYAYAKKATKKTKATYKKAKSEYNKAVADYKRTSTAAKKAKSAYSSVKKYAKRGTTSKVKSYTTTAKKQATRASSYKNKTKAHMKKVSKHTSSAKRSMR
ncbi:CAP domain-containing protein [Timonella sp. A28]|uniref:CAP domain-containing protein n=1 Tax=Timonella sp. A28 TaxID=3442640 RepID=UPI003EC00786